jgi:hypothetical protein
MWKSKEILKKEAADTLFPVIKGLELQGLFNHYDLVITWDPEAEEALIGFLDAGDIKEILTGIELLHKKNDLE